MSAARQPLLSFLPQFCPILPLAHPSDVEEGALAVYRADKEMRPSATSRTVFPATPAPLFCVGSAPMCAPAEPDPASSECTSTSPVATTALKTRTATLRVAWFPEPVLLGVLPDKPPLSTELRELLKD